MRVSVFRGGFERDAAFAVAGATLTVLATLADKLFLSRDSVGRFQIHGLLRQFAEAKLTRDTVADNVARKSHARYYCAFLERQNTSIRGRSTATAHGEIDREQANVDAGFDWSVRHDSMDQVNIYVESLARYLQNRNRFREGDKIFSDALCVLEERFSLPQRLPSFEESHTLALIEKQRSICRDGNGFCSKARESSEESIPVSESIGSTHEI